MMEEKARKIQMIAVISSILDNSAWSEMCNAVRTNKQKPNRLAAVPRMCGEVLFAKNEIFESNEIMVKVILSANER